MRPTYAQLLFYYTTILLYCTTRLHNLAAKRERLVRARLLTHAQTKLARGPRATVRTMLCYDSAPPPQEKLRGRGSKGDEASGSAAAEVAEAESVASIARVEYEQVGLYESIRVF